MFFLLLLTYLIGGVSFIPILLIIAFLYLYYQSEPIKLTHDVSEGGNTFKQKSVSSSSSLPEDQQLLPELTPELPRLYRAGWLTVRQSYELTSSSSESGYMGLITNSYRNFIDNRSTQSKRPRAKDLFYSVLKQNVLFLYPDQDQVECTAAIKVSLYQVDLYPTGSPDPELFVKRKAIRLTPIHDHSTTENPTYSTPLTDPPSDHQPADPSPWFVFTKNNLEKEDWYHLLIAASKLAQPNSKATFQRDALLFDSQDMAKLVEGIDQQPDPIPMRWMNAMLGRLFLSTYRTHAFENWIIDRIMKKLTKVQTPSFLSAINVREVNVGSTTPFFSKPMLKELTVDGDASMEVKVDYKGQFRITIETVATINLGTHFKPYVVNLVLAVVLKELNGNLLLKIKRPPTNRLWFGFTAMPHLILDLQPVVSTRQIKWALVLKPIESRIREVVMESLVYPNLDDLVFFDTQPYTHHGGIWGDAARKENSTPETRDDHASDPPANVEEPSPKNKTPFSSHQDSNHPAESQHPQNTSVTTAREDSGHLHDALRLRNNTSSLSDLSSNPIAAGEPLQTHSTPLVNQPENKRSSWFSTARRQDTASTLSSQNSNRNQPKIRTAVQQSSDLEDGDAVAMLQKFLQSHPEASTSSSPLPTPSLGKSPSPHPPVFQPAHSSNLSEPLKIESAPPNDALSNNFISPEPCQLPEGATDIKDSAASPSPPKANSNHSKNTSPLRPAPPPPHLRSVPPPPAQSLPPTFLPPPTRMAQPMRSPNLTNNQPSNGSILNQLRTRATDKEAIAASVTQARDVVIKWGAAWASKRKLPQANHTMYPYNSGFNPIQIDQVDHSQDPKTSMTSIPRMPDQKHSLSNSTDITNRVSNNPPNILTETQEEDSNHLAALHPDRSQTAAENPPTLDPSSSLSKSISKAHSPFEENQVSLEDQLPIQEKQKYYSNSKPNSIISTTTYHNGDDEEIHSGVGNNNGNGKRNLIFSSNGQFVPPAPQSTTGLSILSSPRSEVLTTRSNSDNSSTKLVSVDDGLTPNANTSRSGELIAQDMRSRSKSSPQMKKGEILSEKSSYKPAPMMSIPGIKDSTHRFGLGSDSISKLGFSQQQQPSFSDHSGGIEHSATSDTGLSSANLHSHIHDTNSDSVNSHSNASLLHPAQKPQPQPPPLESMKSNLSNHDEQGKEIIEENDSSSFRKEEIKLSMDHDENQGLIDRKSNFKPDECDSKTDQDDHDQTKNENAKINKLKISDHNQLETSNPLNLHQYESNNSKNQVYTENQDQNENQGDEGKSQMDNSVDSPVDHLAWGF